MKPTAESGPPLAAFQVSTGGPFANIALQKHRPDPFAGAPGSLPIALDLIAHLGVIEGLTEDQQSFLAENGFVVLNTQEEQFHKIRGRVIIPLYASPEQRVYGDSSRSRKYAKSLRIT